MIASRPLFAENLEFVKRAWTEERLTFRGAHFKAESIEVIPKPLQKPHPPIRLAANSVDTFVFAGEHGYPIFAGGPVNPIPVLGERLVIYKDALAKAGKKLPDDWLAAALMVQVGRDRASVRATIEPSLRHYFTSVGEIIEPEGPAPEQQAQFKAMQERLRAVAYETVDSTMGIFGDAEYCIDRIAELRDRFNFSRLVCWFEVGGQSGHRNVIESMRAFAEKVLPKFS
jgi:alkanesulfonate monooxygenase SsuD/methylene tetrahydromethanopterin reductase-like flavin-dependent oxidoreductase (luciferase family)